MPEVVAAIPKTPALPECNPAVAAQDISSGERGAHKHMRPHPLMFVTTDVAIDRIEVAIDWWPEPDQRIQIGPTDV
jgi:hypothetical protein